MPAGYSGTPLVKKLGLKPAQRVLFVAAPDGYDALLGSLPDDVRVMRAARGELDFIHLFSKRQSDLLRRLPTLVRALAKDGTLWISWPKRASGVATDLSGDVVRGAGLQAGLVDVKVCAVDETWSGLKFMYRLRDR